MWYDTLVARRGGTQDSGHVMKPVHPKTFHVTRREALVAAIKQRTAPIVIENEELARPFERYRWTIWPFAASRIVRLAFPEIEFKRKEWRVDHTRDYKIILVPRR
jgi:hypothetical protein